MEEVLDHNQEAEQIFRQYGRLLELVAAAQLPGRPEDAEECVQDAVWAFVEGRAPWDPAQGSKQTWLCVLVRSRAKDRRRALAARMEDQVDDDVARRRVELVVDLQSRVMDGWNESRLGETVEVLCEGFDTQEGCYVGRTWADSPEIDGRVLFTAGGVIPAGEFVYVRLTGVSDGDLTGEIEE